MTSSTAVIAFILFLTLLTASIPLYGHATKTLTGTFQTTVMEKETKNSMIYVGFFMPFIVYSLKVEMGIQVNVDRGSYNQIEAGDSVLINRYSNGTYRIGSGA